LTWNTCAHWLTLTLITHTWRKGSLPRSLRNRL